jgi:diazepam-binding inhibitor (GABA receptor modulating acyl-CoA-binding protein)
VGKKEFDEALERVNSLPEQPANVLLELYGLFKQATIGDVNVDRPPFLDFKGRAKFDAWQSRKGMTQDAAMDAYVEVVERLLKEHGQS